MTEPVRILQIVSGMQQGGIENYIMNMYRNIDRDKLQFDFLEHDEHPGFFDNEITSLGGNIYRINGHEFKYNPLLYTKHLKEIFSQNQKYHVIHGHEGKTALLYTYVAKKSGIAKRIVHAHEDSYVHTFNGFMQKTLIQQSWRFATDLYACSSKAGKYYFGKHPFTVRYNAIDTNRFAFNNVQRINTRGKLGIQPSTLVLGNIGRCTAQKNQLFLLDIFAALRSIRKDSRLILVGTGELEHQLYNKAADLGILSAIHIIQSTATPEYLYSAMDAFVLPSLYEGLPLAGVESQASGLPTFFSSSISREVAITDQAHFIPLEDSPLTWANKILEITKTTNTPNRSIFADKVRNSGFDVKKNSQLMQDAYLSLANEAISQN